jgi:metal transporter CNNM
MAPRDWAKPASTPPPPPLLHDTRCPQILRRSGTDRQKRLAQRIHPLLARPHVLLVTLLVCNAVAAEALPLVLDRLADPITAVIVSVTVVLLFGG